MIVKYYVNHVESREQSTYFFILTRNLTIFHILCQNISTILNKNRYF